MNLRCLLGHRWVVIEGGVGNFGFGTYTATATLECRRCRKRRAVRYAQTYSFQNFQSEEEARAWIRGQGESAAPDAMPKSFSEVRK